MKDIIKDLTKIVEDIAPIANTLSNMDMGSFFDKIDTEMEQENKHYKDKLKIDISEKITKDEVIKRYCNNKNMSKKEVLEKVAKRKQDIKEELTQRYLDAKAIRERNIIKDMDIARDMYERYKNGNLNYIESQQILNEILKTCQ